jgi:hypothetical protein
MTRVELHIAQIEQLAEQLGWPDARFDDVAHDAATIRRCGGQAFLWAIADYGTVLYWFHLTPNPWKSLGYFLETTRRELPDVRHYIVGLAREPIEISMGSRALDVLSLFDSTTVRP